MSDTISRADAMGAVQDHFNADGFKGYDDGQKMMDRIKALPSADALHGWVPCSERLPSEDGSYLVTSSFGKVYTAHFYSEYGRWQYNRRGLIEAWMPLPKPYREDGEEE